MNEIIEALIQWCADNGYLVDIQIGTAFPSYAVFITLKKGKFKYTHEFYMAGGVFCLEHWRDFPRELEIEAFLKDAREQFEVAETIIMRSKNDTTTDCNTVEDDPLRNEKLRINYTPNKEN